MNSDTRINNILEGLKSENFGVALLQETRLKLADRCAGFDILVRCGCIVISFGHDGDPDNVPAGVAIILNNSMFDTSDIVRVWAP